MNFDSPEILEHPLKAEDLNKVLKDETERYHTDIEEKAY